MGESASADVSALRVAGLLFNTLSGAICTMKSIGKVTVYSAVLLSLVLLSSIPVQAESGRNAKQHSFTAKVADVRLNAELIAQGKTHEDKVSVEVSAEIFDQPIHIPDARTAPKHEIPEVDFLIRYTKANLEGSVQEILAFWHTSARAEKQDMMSRPEMFKANRGYFMKNPGLTVSGIIFQEGNVAVMTQRGPLIVHVLLTKQDGRYVLTDQSSNDLELAIIEASRFSK